MINALSLEQAVEQLQKYFKENEDADVYVAALDIDGNSKVFGGCVVFVF
jgi:hypothetical protein